MKGVKMQKKKKYKNATSPRPINKETQDTQTPHDFFSVVEHIWKPEWDLAAHELNNMCDKYITLTLPTMSSPRERWIVQDSLTVNWHTLAPGKWLWLNPPFADVAPWVKKCVEEMRLGAKILTLVKASVDTIWFRDWVENVASEVRFLKPRLKFVGHKTTFPAPLMLVIYEQNKNKATKFWQFDWREYLNGLNI